VTAGSQKKDEGTGLQKKLHAGLKDVGGHAFYYRGIERKSSGIHRQARKKSGGGRGASKRHGRFLERTSSPTLEQPPFQIRKKTRRKSSEERNKTVRERYSRADSPYLRHDE